MQLLIELTYYCHLVVLFGGGDVIAQLVVGNEPFDRSRFKRAWIFGTFILGPLAHLHFNFLEWFVVRKVICFTGYSRQVLHLFYLLSLPFKGTACHLLRCLLISSPTGLLGLTPSTSSRESYSLFHTYIIRNKCDWSVPVKCLYKHLCSNKWY